MRLQLFRYGHRRTPAYNIKRYNDNCQKQKCQCVQISKHIVEGVYFFFKENSIIGNQYRITGYNY